MRIFQCLKIIHIRVTLPSSIAHFIYILEPLGNPEKNKMVALAVMSQFFKLIGPLFNLLQGSTHYFLPRA